MNRKQSVEDSTEPNSNESKEYCQGGSHSLRSRASRNDGRAMWHAPSHRSLLAPTSPPATPARIVVQLMVPYLVTFENPGGGGVNAAASSVPAVDWSRFVCRLRQMLREPGRGERLPTKGPLERTCAPPSLVSMVQHARLCWMTDQLSRGQQCRNKLNTYPWRHNSYRLDTSYAGNHFGN